MEQREMPRYKCHKEVWALKIASITTEEGGLDRLTFEDDRYEPIVVAHAWTEKRGAKAGGYYVVYQDGYTSFSPAEAFEEGYTLIGA